jgi:hypothetical protein
LSYSKIQLLYHVAEKSFQECLYATQRDVRDFAFFECKSAPTERVIVNLVEIVKREKQAQTILKKQQEDAKLPSNDERLKLAWKNTYVESRQIPLSYFPMTVSSILENIDSFSSDQRAQLFYSACEQREFTIARFLYPFVSVSDLATNYLSELCCTKKGELLMREILTAYPHRYIKLFSFRGARTYRVMDLVKTRCGLDPDDGSEEDYYSFMTAARNNDLEYVSLFFEQAMRKALRNHSKNQNDEVETLSKRLLRNGWIDMQNTLRSCLAKEQ